MLRNVALNWAAFAVNVAVTFLLSPFIVHTLGNSAYGVWVLVVSLVGYLGLLDFGIRGAVTRYVARYHGISDHEGASRIVSSALAIFCAVGAVVILFTSGASFYATQFVKIPIELHGHAQTVILLSGFSIAVVLVSGVFGGVIAGLQRFAALNAIDIGITLVRAVSIWAVLHSGFTLVGLAVLELVFVTLKGLTYAFISYRLYPRLRLGLSFCDHSSLKLIFSFSVYSFILSVFTQLIYYSDAIVIGFFLPVASVTFFSIAANLVTYTRALLGGITTAVTPRASVLDAKERHAELRQAVSRYAAYCSMLVLPIATTFLIRGGTFISLWMGPEYAVLSTAVLRILTLVLLVGGANSVIWSILYGMNKHKGIIPALLAEGLLNLLLSCILIRRFGIVGVAWGTAIPGVLSQVFFFPWYLRRCLGISVGDYCRSAWLRPFLAVLPFAFVTYVLERLWIPTRVVGFFLQVGVALPFALLAFWYICFDQPQRIALARRLLDPLQRVRAILPT